MKKNCLVLAFIFVGANLFANNSAVNSTSNYLYSNCSILATASEYLENNYYGGVTQEESDEAWEFYYEACISVGHVNYLMPVFL